MTDLMAKLGRETGERTSRIDRPTRFEVHPDVIDGERVVRKQATDGTADLLRREASVLSQIDSPHVVTLVEFADSDTGVELVTVDDGSRTLADPSKISRSELVRALRNCVTAVGELHSSGWAHGSIRPDHVIIGARGRIRLCSLGSARRQSTTSDARPEAELRTRFRGDVKDLIELVDQVATSPVTDGSWRERRRRNRLNRAISSCASRARDTLRATDSPTEVLGYLDELLRDVAHGPDGAPSDHRTGAPIRATTGGHEPAVPLPRDRRRLLRTALVVVATTIGVLSLASATGASSRSNPRRALAPTVAPDDTTGSTTFAEGSVRSTGIDPEDALPPQENDTGPWSGANTPHQDSDPGNPVRHDGNRIINQGSTYTVGDEGDVTTTGDFMCNGTENVALLRPSTGEVFYFDDWAEVGSPSTGRAVGIHPGATGLSPVADTCGTLTVELAGGRTITVEIGSPGTTPSGRGGPVDAEPAGGGSAR